MSLKLSAASPEIALSAEETSEQNAAAGTPVKWSAPSCPFAVTYLPFVLDDIRSDAMHAADEAGGSETGGILLGYFREQQLTITGCIPFVCANGNGPFFVLSEKDRRNFRYLLTGAQRDPAGGPVGWYRSQWSSAVSLSDYDREMHQRFFPEPWQVLLILQMDPALPAQASFFFRGLDGAIETEGSPFELGPLPPEPVPAPALPYHAPEPPRAPFGFGWPFRSFKRIASRRTDSEEHKTQALLLETAAEVERLRREHASLREENAALQASLEDLARDRDSLRDAKAAFASAPPDTSAVETERDELRKQIADLEAALAREAQRSLRAETELKDMRELMVHLSRRGSR